MGANQVSLVTKDANNANVQQNQAAANMQVANNESVQTTFEDNNINNNEGSCFSNKQEQETSDNNTNFDDVVNLADMYQNETESAFPEEDKKIDKAKRVADTYKEIAGLNNILPKNLKTRYFRHDCRCLVRESF